MKVKKLNGKSNVLGKNVKKYRELRHLTQRELSDKIALLGVDIYHSDISQIENQKLLLKDFEIIAICKALNITYEQLFENTDNIFDQLFASFYNYINYNIFDYFNQMLIQNM